MASGSTGTTLLLFSSRPCHIPSARPIVRLVSPVLCSLASSFALLPIVRGWLERLLETPDPVATPRWSKLVRSAFRPPVSGSAPGVRAAPSLPPRPTVGIVRMATASVSAIGLGCEAFISRRSFAATSRPRIGALHRPPPHLKPLSWSHPSLWPVGCKSALQAARPGNDGFGATPDNPFASTRPLTAQDVQKRLEVCRWSPAPTRGSVDSPQAVFSL